MAKKYLFAVYLFCFSVPAALAQQAERPEPNPTPSAAVVRTSPEESALSVRSKVNVFAGWGRAQDGDQLPFEGGIDIRSRTEIGKSDFYVDLNPRFALANVGDTRLAENEPFFEDKSVMHATFEEGVGLRLAEGEVTVCGSLWNERGGCRRVSSELFLDVRACQDLNNPTGKEIGEHYEGSLQYVLGGGMISANIGAYYDEKSFDSQFIRRTHLPANDDHETSFGAFCRIKGSPRLFGTGLGQVHAVGEFDFRLEDCQSLDQTMFRTGLELRLQDKKDEAVQILYARNLFDGAEADSGWVFICYGSIF